MPQNRFASLLNEQIAHEFSASQQYVAIAVYSARHIHGGSSPARLNQRTRVIQLRVSSLRTTPTV